MTVSSSRRYNYWASTLLFADLALGHIVALITRQGLYSPANTAKEFVVGIGTTMLLFGLIVCIRKEYRWARILSVILFVIGVLSFPFIYTTIFATAWTAVWYVIRFFAQLISSLLIIKGFKVDKQ